MSAKKRERVRPRARPFRYCVGKGNNPDLIRQIMSTRDWWEEIGPEETEVPYNFKWKQLNFRKAELESLGTVKGVRQCCNHFENNMEMCSKSGLFRNMSYLYEKVLQRDVFQAMPVTFNFSSMRDPEFLNFIELFHQCEKHKQQARQARAAVLSLHIQTASETDEETEQTEPNMGDQSELLSRRIARLSKVATEEGSPDGKPTVVALNYKFSNREVHPDNARKNVWILKPGIGTNRAIGIKVFSELAELEEHIDKWNTRKHPCFNWIVQKYIERPLLVHGRKFDIRAYSLVTHNLDLYFYNQGYLRTSGEAYDLDNLEDRNVHLTNWAVQKKAESYGEHEDANQMDYQQFQDYLDEHHPDAGVSVEDGLKERMKELVTHTFLASGSSFNLNNYKYCIELFGYDFMIDQDFQVFLIEVNNNPCLCTPGDTLLDLLPAMLEDVVKLAVDPLFPPYGDPLGKTKPKVSSTDFVLLHSSTSKATINMREKRERDHQARTSLRPAASQKSPAFDRPKGSMSQMDLSSACAFLENSSNTSNERNDLTVSPLRHQVELLAMTAKKNEARLLAERLRAQAWCMQHCKVTVSVQARERERQATVQQPLPGSETLAAPYLSRGGQPDSRFHLHIETRKNENRQTFL